MQKLLLCVAALLAFTSCDDVLLDSVEKRASEKEAIELEMTADLTEDEDTTGDDEKSDTLDLRHPITFDVDAKDYNEIGIDI